MLFCYFNFADILPCIFWYLACQYMTSGYDNTAGNRLKIKISGIVIQKGVPHLKIRWTFSGSVGTPKEIYTFASCVIVLIIAFYAIFASY